ncbi:MAG: ABC transporter ATP-binding protein [Verrucomicrobiota bacterium]
MNDSLPLQMRNVQARYVLNWRRKSVLALDHLDLELKRGEIFALLGPNGSGKTTTFKLILGFLKPQQGTILIQGESAGTRKAREKVGYLPENPYFPKYLSGREVLETYGKLSGVSSDLLRRRIEIILEIAQMGAFAEKPLHTYSKGMIQRVSLGQALVHDPQLLLLDEPTTGLDPQGVDAMKEAMLRLRGMGKTILFTSHLMEQVETLADRAAILYQGKKLVEGSMKDLLGKTEGATIRVKGLSSEQLNGVKLALKDFGATSVEVSPAAGTLENLFRRYTE